MAAQGLQDRERHESPTVAFAQVLATNGTWLLLHGAPLEGDDQPRVAVIIEPALTGSSTAEIANALVLSSLTVQNT